MLLPDYSSSKKSKKSPQSQIYSDDSVVLIDFEYCGYNYRGYDIANHFNEWSYDYSNPEHPQYFVDAGRYPTESQQRFFIAEYLKHLKKQQSAADLRVTNQEVEHVMYEAEHFLLASHLHWTLWGISNALHSTIAFGYWVRYFNKLNG